jgi:porin
MIYILKRFGLLPVVAAAALTAGGQASSFAADLVESDKNTAAAPTAPWAGDIFERQRLTGDWFGIRNSLGQYGIDIQVTASQFIQSVVSGGINENTEVGAKFDYIMNVDGGKLGLWKGLYINVHAETRLGKDVLADAGPATLNNTALLTPLPGEYQGTNVTGLAVYQAFEAFDTPMMAFAGKLNAIDLVSGLLPKTLDGGLRGFQNPNATVTAMPWLRYVNLSLYGAGAWTMNGALAQTGIVAMGATNQTTTWSFDGAFDDGVGFLAFHRFIFDIDNNPGYVLIAAGASTKDYPSLAPSDWGLNIGGECGDGVVATCSSGNPWGVAAYWSQVFWQPDPNDPNRFARFMIGGSVADNNPSFSNFNIFGNLEGFGLSDARPGDRMGIAGWYNHLTDDFTELASQVPGIELQTDLWGFEAYYSFELVPSVHITPNVQVVRNAREGDDPAVIVGGRFVTDF